MNKTTQPRLLDGRSFEQLGRISPTSFQDATKAVQAFGCSMAKASRALEACGGAAKVLKDALNREAATKRPCYRR